MPYIRSVGKREGKMVRIAHETIFEDGGYSAEVHAFGAVYAANFVMGEVRLTLIVGSRPAMGWKRKATPEAARKAVAARLAELGPEFMAKHRALYELA